MHSLRQASPGNPRDSYSSVTDLEYDDAYGVYSTGICSDFWELYATVPRVRIRSRYLKIPFLLSNAFLFAFIIAYELIYKLNILEDLHSEATATVWLSEPKHNFWTCNNVDTDCDVIIEEDDGLNYCKPHRHDNETVHGCQHFDRHVVANGKFTRQLFIASTVMTLNQTKARKDVKWKTSSKQSHYVKGIENYMLTIRHSFTTAEHFTAYNNFGSQGFLVYRANSSSKHTYEHPIMGKIAKLERLPCSRTAQDGSIIIEDCSNLETSVAHWFHTPVCENQKEFEDNHRNPGCTKTIYGDYLSFRKVFEAAGIGSIDDYDPYFKKPRRLIGTSLLMDIIIVNDDPVDFWTWPFGRKIKYYYAFYEVAIDPQKLDMQYSSFYYRDTRVEPDEWAETHRIVRQLTGIPIILRTRVHFREFSLFRTIAASIVCFAAFRVARVFVEEILVRLYRVVPHRGLGQASLTYMYYVKKDTPLPEHVGEHIHEGAHDLLEKLEKSHERKCLKRPSLEAHSMKREKIEEKKGQT